MTTVPKYTGNKSLGAILEEGAGRQKRFYKIVKVLEPIKCPPELKVTQSQLLSQMAALKGRANRIKKDIPYEKDKKKKAEMKEKVRNIFKEISEKFKLYKKLKEDQPSINKDDTKKSKKKSKNKKASDTKILPIKFRRRRGVLNRKIRSLNEAIMEEKDDDKADEIDKEIMKTVKDLEKLHDEYGVPFEQS